MKLGVLGGTFDPVHIGHLVLGETAREQLDLDRVLFVPAGQPWRKAGRQISPGKARLEMLKVAVAGNSAFEVSDLELNRAGPSYTAETLAAVRERNPDATLYLLLGEDALADLPNWRDPGRILELATLAIAQREGCGAAPDPYMEGQPGIRGHSIVWLNMPHMGISASDIRDRVRRGLSVKYRVPPAVEEYIREQQLYVTAGKQTN